MLLLGAGLLLACPESRSDGSGPPKGLRGLRTASQDRGPTDARVPNILLRTQDDRPVRLYDDLVKGRTVLVNFIYTGCRTSCIPTTANLAMVHKVLGDRMGRDLLFLSISLDPVADQPPQLLDYASRFGPLQGWYFLTGSQADIDDLRRKWGAYDLDPTVDADKTQHAGILIVGNDTTNRWGSLPALMDYRHIAHTVLRIARRPRVSVIGEDVVPESSAGLRVIVSGDAPRSPHSRRLLRLSTQPTSRIPTPPSAADFDPFLESPSPTCEVLSEAPTTITIP